MRKINYLILAGLLSVFDAGAADNVTIQGIPVDGPLARSARMLMDSGMQADDNSSDFGFDDIRFWVGEGSSEAALVLQWNVGGEGTALVWGYRFDGEVTGAQLLTDVVRADERLYVVVQNSAFGLTLVGIGYDADGDGEIGVLLNGEEQVLDDSRMLVTTSSSGFAPKDADDYFQAGFDFDGYWTYWTSDDGTLPPADYASTGMSGRTLHDGCVDGWAYSDGTLSWNPLEAVAAPQVAPVLPEAFTDGLFIINEGWFGHDMGSVNWISTDGTAYYQIDSKVNGEEIVLGNTSQFGQIYGDYFYVVSKQSPMLAVFDAQTMQLVRKFDTVGSGDGRSVLGISSDKVYVGTSHGIYVLDVATLTLSEQPIEGTVGESVNSAQIGMMARVGSCVFAAQQNNGILVIDPETDTVEETITAENICGLTVGHDGYVWAVAESEILRINPVSLESQVQTLPNSMVSPWGTWMADKMCASLTENALFYAYGGSYTNSETHIGKLLVGETGALTEDADFQFALPAGTDESHTQQLYGAIGIDPISDCLVVMTTQSGWGTNYSYNWVHYVDTETGEIVKTVPLKNDEGNDYYWFQAYPVFPDNAAPELHVDDLVLTGETTFAIPVNELVSDEDNLPALAVVEVETTANEVFTAACDGLELTVVPVGNGEGTLTVRANSNGKVVEKTVTVTVSGLASLGEVSETSIKVYPTVVVDLMTVSGVAGGTAEIYTMSGALVGTFILDKTGNINLSGMQSGAYIVRIVSGNNVAIQKFVKL